MLSDKFKNTWQWSDNIENNCSFLEKMGHPLYQ